MKTCILWREIQSVSAWKTSAWSSEFFCFRISAGQSHEDWVTGGCWSEAWSTSTAVLKRPSCFPLFLSRVFPVTSTSTCLHLFLSHLLILNEAFEYTSKLLNKFLRWSDNSRICVACVQNSECIVHLCDFSTSFSLSSLYKNVVCHFALHVIWPSSSPPLPLSLRLLSLFTIWGLNTVRSGSVVMEGGDLSAGGSHENPCEVEFLLEREEGLEEQRSPDFSEDMEDSGFLESERSRAGAGGLGPSSAWALAFFGADCFGPEVIEYVANLGMHTSSPSLDVKAEVSKAVSQL